MKITFAVLLMTTALGAGSAALAAYPGNALTNDAAVANALAASGDDLAVTLIDADGDDDSRIGGWIRSLSGDDDEDDEGDDDCEEEGDDDDCAAGMSNNAAKAGTVAPPKNGLFTDGTAPAVKSN